MTTTLDQILATKRREVAEARELYPVKLLERSMFFTTPCVSLRRYLERPDYLGVIAEIKRRSPSKGVINQYITVEQLSVGYMQAGASALSILTDSPFFGGKAEDLTAARRYNFCPILRKDFIIDEYQVLEAKSIGADVVLLIAAALTPDEVRHLAQVARGVGLEVLLEVHTAAEIASHLCDGVDLVGVNNRDLATFAVDTGVAERLAPEIPPQFTKIAESGIGDPATLRRLRECGYRGFLIGEAFMRTSKPDEACRSFIQQCIQSV